MRGRFAFDGLTVEVVAVEGAQLGADEGQTVIADRTAARLPADGRAAGRPLRRRRSTGRGSAWISLALWLFEKLQLFEHAFLSRSNMGICDRNHLSQSYESA
jgi:hypothetical protein